MVWFLSQSLPSSFSTKGMNHPPRFHLFLRLGTGVPHKSFQIGPGVTAQCPGQMLTYWQSPFCCGYEFGFFLVSDVGNKEKLSWRGPRVWTFLDSTLWICRRKRISSCQLPLMVGTIIRQEVWLHGGSRWRTTHPIFVKGKGRKNPAPFLVLWGETKDSRWPQWVLPLMMASLGLTKKFKLTTLLFNNLCFLWASVTSPSAWS